MASNGPPPPPPSHPEIQEVIRGEDGAFTSKSLSKIHVAPFETYAAMTMPPCTLTETPTYATVQVSEDKHIFLNSDLLYLNHSCEPSLIIDTEKMQILAGPKGLKPGDELTFFYPSTEFVMAQSFECNCGTASCRGRISGARDMSATELEGFWLSAHIKRMKAAQANGTL